MLKRCFRYGDVNMRTQISSQKQRFCLFWEIDARNKHLKLFLVHCHDDHGCFVLRMTTEAESKRGTHQLLVNGKDIKNSLISLYNIDVTTSWWFVKCVAKRQHDVMAAVRELIY